MCRCLLISNRTPEHETELGNLSSSSGIVISHPEEHDPSLSTSPSSGDPKNPLLETPKQSEYGSPTRKGSGGGLMAGKRPKEHRKPPTVNLSQSQKDTKDWSKDSARDTKDSARDTKDWSKDSAKDTKDVTSRDSTKDTNSVGKDVKDTKNLHDVKEVPEPKEEKDSD